MRESILVSIGRITKICGLSGLICVILPGVLEVAQRIWLQSQLVLDSSKPLMRFLSYSYVIFNGLIAIGAALIAVAVVAKVVAISVKDPKDKEEALH